MTEAAPGPAALAPFASITLSGLVLPPGAAILREYARPSERRDALYEARYDRHTLAYDHWTDGDTLHLVCPRLLNLWPYVKSTHPKRQRYLRWEHLTFPAPGPSTLSIGSDALPLAPGHSLSPCFDGMRVLMAVSQNNPLDWIADWARFHVCAQGADAVLLFDNGSTDYTPRDITQCLSRVPGLRRALVVSAPFPYGPAHGKTSKLETPARFFQTAMFNLARLRFLGKARSVLSLDIDEMVTRSGTRTVFEAAEASRVGLAQIRGSWVYCSTPGARRLQSEHDHRRDPEQPCTPKWCVVPNKLAGKVGWTVHRIFGDLDALCNAHDQHFLHCQQTSTGWKTAREGKQSELRRDPALAETWARYLG